MDILCEIIKSDLSQSAVSAPTETNWYIYGSTLNQDAIGENIRPTIMVRERAGGFITNFSISDHDFAVNIDTILSFQKEFESRLSLMNE